MRIVIWKKLVAGTVLVAAVVLTPAAAYASGIGGFSVRPATFNPAIPSTRAYFQPTIRRGRTQHDQVIVANANAKPVQLRVDAVDGVTAVTSGAVYANRGVAKRGAALWVRPTSTFVTVPAHSQLRVGFAVHVPRRATPGDHLAGIALQNAHPQHSGGKFSVTEIIRAVVGIEVRVPGRARPQIHLSGVVLRALPGTTVPSVVVTLGDAGRLLCQPRLSVSLAGPGQPLHAITRKLDTILPGDVIPYPFLWPHPLAAGTYATSVRATGCGAAATLTTHAALGHKLAGTAADPSAGGPSDNNNGGGGTPVVLLALVAAGGIGIGIAGALKLGRMSARRQPSPGS